MSSTDTTTAGFEPVLGTETLPVGVMRAAALRDGTRLCLVHTADAGVCAVLDRCPHRDFALTNGELTPDGRIECAWHGAQFDPATGAELVGPGCDALTRFAVRIVNDTIEVGPRLTT